MLIFNFACLLKVIPVLMATALGAGGGSLYLIRLAFRNSDVSWRRNANPEPWQEYETKQYKFYSQIDHDKLERPRPKF
ncbi:cytochrome c oxidase subunit NDUFA4-like protein [Leptotrombidium deliense]|uniref:Cytochrome c oxidase subunit NDUFA4-like protein n=1 Tax=Leptotrombidium deliense TaxID=299467 RepID=A0A443RSN5_9ACAR|nr:cytochrome c oxidase subunit NDUFA4-like protein [Leptotrombidium deliense]